MPCRSRHFGRFRWCFDKMFAYDNRELSLELTEVLTLVVFLLSKKEEKIILSIQCQHKMTLTDVSI
ncbi:hypothetical protein A0U40_02355 [[Bacillus] sp. KCTC 13219]|nr:hypothetical protein A0U40_02355 [[Bacillus] sp. KCTC 13219]